MTYEALARGATGLFYFAFDTGTWKIREHPETWAALQAVVKEVKERQPLFEAQPQWWPKNHRFGDPAHRFNAALESSITSTRLRVSTGNDFVPAGEYILAVNNTERRHEYSFALPPSKALTLLGGRAKATCLSDNVPRTSVPLLGENRSVPLNQNRIQDSFVAYAVHVYGPLR